MNELVMNRSRRGALRVIGCSSLVSLLPFGIAGCNWSRAPLKAIAQRMVSLLFYPEKAKEIGLLYIAEVSTVQGQTYEQLTEALLERLGLEQSQLSVENMALIDEKIKAVVHQDFMDEDVVILRGWMLSRTELMLCALATVFQ
jgi:hypothetical protein